jgi:hypothetical protein
VGQHSGIPNGSEIISTNSRIMKAAAMYTASTRVTFLRLSSCQNWDSLLVIALGLLSASYGTEDYESNFVDKPLNINEKLD